MCDEQKEYLEERKEAWLEPQFKQASSEEERLALLAEADKRFSIEAWGPNAATTIG